MIDALLCNYGTSYPTVLPESRYKKNSLKLVSGQNEKKLHTPRSDGANRRLHLHCLLAGRRRLVPTSSVPSPTDCTNSPRLLAEADRSAPGR
jgi:hypothetical protein